MLEAQWSRGNFVCVGLDSEFGKIPESMHRKRHDCEVDFANTIVAFNKKIVEATHDIVCAYKPNIAFYEAYGADGIAALHRTIVEIHVIAPDVPVILDAKRADIGNTNNGYVEMAFNYLRVDAITVHPYLGREALQPFLARADKGVFVLCRTSNPGANEFQDMRVSHVSSSNVGTLPLYSCVAIAVSQKWNTNNNCGLVVGATYPDELAEVRRIVDDIPILIPGIGAQGGDLEKTVQAGRDKYRKGMIINSSRGIIFADNPRGETEKLRDSIDQYRHL